MSSSTGSRGAHPCFCTRADEIVQISKADTLVELGSGSSEKTKVLLDAMVRADSLARVVPFDVSETMLVGAAEEQPTRSAIAASLMPPV